MYEIFVKLNSKKIKQKFIELPDDYVITKFYELGYKVSHNKFNNTYNSCCPICKEGKSWGRKKRCFYIPEQDLIYCHNCGSSLKPFNWIKEVSGMTSEEIEKDIENNVISIDLEEEMAQTIPKKVPSLPEDSINLSDPAQVAFYKDNHIVQTALTYLRSRKLDIAVNKPDVFYISLKDKFQKNRLVIPFKDSSGKIIHYQTRRLFEWDEKPDYLSKFNSDKTIFGIEKVDATLDDVFIFEGPFDSCFVKNGVAVAGINEGNHRFTPIQLEQFEELALFNKYWVLDNQWIDKTAREKTLVLLEQGECVFIWPDKLKQFKDFNDICKHQHIGEIKGGFIKKYSVCGPSAIMRLKLIWSKLN